MVRVQVTSKIPPDPGSRTLRQPPKAIADLARIKVLGESGDGRYFVEDGRRRKSIVHLATCVECESRFVPAQTFWAHSDGRKALLCPACNWAAQEAERERGRVTQGAAERRRLALERASPAWRDREKIEKIYQDARDFTQLTGVVHEVDHFYPLQGELCCGLHVPENLRVVTFAENRAKTNGHPRDEAPALVAFVKQYGEIGLRKWIDWAKASIK